MVCVNAAETAMPPEFVAKGKVPCCVYFFNIQAAHDGTKWTGQEKRWMSDDTGEKRLDNVFLDCCGPQRA